MVMPTNQQLAAAMAGQTAQQPQMQSAEEQQLMELLTEIIDLLLQGVTPEELVEQGIPAELVMQAITMLEEEQASGGEVQPTEEAIVAETAAGQ